MTDYSVHVRCEQSIWHRDRYFSRQCLRRARFEDKFGVKLCRQHYELWEHAYKKVLEAEILRSYAEGSRDE